MQVGLKNDLDGLVSQTVRDFFIEGIAGRYKIFVQLHGVFIE